MAVAQSSSGRVTKTQGEGAVLEVFFPTDNAFYSIAFGTDTKMAELIKMPFGMMTLVGCWYHVLDGGPDLPRGRSNFLGNAKSTIMSLLCSVDKESFNRQ